MQDVELHECLLTAFAFHSRSFGSDVCVVFFLTALMTMGFLLITRHSQRVQIIHHNFNMVADRSKT
jgi:positive regulator of sigma E activity